jgi:uncharacterized protein YndB with AHSA1/START domain/DNA-binding transcriptional ArsR family regulator
MDEVFKALADPGRRALLDRLQVNDGQTLGQLCAGMPMSRQAVSQHLAQLEAANLIVTVRRGREKVHHLNPVPIGEIYDRWIGRYERHRVSALVDLKTALETKPMSEQTFTYSIFIDSTPERIWQALTDGTFTKQYWAGREITSDWKVGSPVSFKVDDSDDVETSGKVLEVDAPRRLSYTWKTSDAAPLDKPSTVTFELNAWGASVQLTVTHGPLPADAMARNGWVAIMSSLKSFVETGNALAATKLWPRRNMHAQSASAL